MVNPTKVLKGRKSKRQSLHDKQMRADDVCRSYNEFVCEVARQSEYSRTGKLLPSKLVDAMVTQEERKDEEVRHVRLRKHGRRRVQASPASDPDERRKPPCPGGHVK